MRVDICALEDEDTKAALLAALAEVGARYAADEGSGEADPGLGVGLHRFRTPDGQELTVFVDAWGVDLEGPDGLVGRVRAVLDAEA
jgi:hypothetical protein